MPAAPTERDILLALLEWQASFGVTEAIGATPLDRYAPPVPAPPGVPAPLAPTAPRPAAATAPAGPAADDGAARLAAARAAAAAATSLAELRAAAAGFEGLAIRQGARNFVFADGHPGARVMIVGEAPGQEEDAAGLPFVGRAGRLLDRMFAAIGLARHAADPARALYITNVLHWRPPGNRRPTNEEIQLSLPFLAAHVALAEPEILVLMGNTPAQALLGRTGILSLRGQWTVALGRPALPMAHPAYLLRNPLAKREAWADLRALRARLAETPPRSRP